MARSKFIPKIEEVITDMIKDEVRDLWAVEIEKTLQSMREKMEAEKDKAITRIALKLSRSFAVDQSAEQITIIIKKGRL